MVRTAAGTTSILRRSRPLARRVRVLEIAEDQRLRARLLASKPLDVVAIRHAIITEHIAVIPQLLDHGLRSSLLPVSH